MTTTDELLIDQPLPGVTRLTLNRPRSRNALTLALVGQLNATLDAIATDPACRIVILTGAGNGFCSGQDMKVAQADHTDANGVVERLRWQTLFAGMAQRMRRMPQIIIAAVRGAAAGAGMALAVAADVRIASRSASFHVASVRIGLTAGESGISYHLPRLIGAGRAFPILLSGRPIEAAEAERIGLVNNLVDDDALPDATLDLCREFLANSPYSTAQTKRIMWAALDAASLDHALEIENTTQILGTMTSDYREATEAFVQKRPPRFTGT